MVGLEKPCTKVEYTGTTRTHVSPHWNMSATFKYGFSSPPAVQVYEEYLILDPVGLISSIGGTLGICIGASIHGFLTFCLSHLVSIISKKTEKKRKTEKKSHETAHSQVMKLADTSVKLSK